MGRRSGSCLGCRVGLQTNVAESSTRDGVSNAWQDGIDQPPISDVQLNIFCFALEGEPVQPPPACVVHTKRLDGLRSWASARRHEGRALIDLDL